MAIDINSKKDFPYVKKYNEENRRKRVYKNIYLNERDKYPLQFSEYKIWYRDGNERNESTKNILLLTSKEYEEALDETNPLNHPTSPIFYGGINKKEKKTSNATPLIKKPTKDINRAHAMLLCPGAQPYPKTDEEAQQMIKAFRTRMLVTIALLLVMILMFILFKN